MTVIALILHLIGFAILLFFGLAVILKNPKSHTNLLFALFCLELLVYLIFNYLSLLPNQSADLVLLWIRLVMAVTSFTGPTLLLLAHTFPKPKLAFPKRWVAALFFLGLTSAAASLSPYLFTSFHYVNGVPLPSPGPLIIIYFLSVVVLFMASFVWLSIKYRRSYGLEKEQLLYFLLGIIINLSLIILLIIIPVNIFKISAFVPYIPFSFLALAVFLGYAILRRRFLDIRPNIARAVSYTCFIIAIATIYSAFFFFGLTVLFDISLDLPIVIGGIALTVVVALSFQPLHKQITKLTNAVFFQGLYNSEELLSKLTHIMSSTIDIDTMCREILSILNSEVKITKAAFLILKDHRIASVMSLGYENVLLMKSPLEAVIHREILSAHHAILFQDLINEDTKEIFRKYDIEALFPIEFNNEEIAILAVGPKVAGNMYSSQDLKLLDTFSSEAGLAIKNAILYENLKLAFEAKSRFISVVSHQLRTPISGVRWSLEMLREDGLSKNDQKTFLNTAYEKTIFIAEQLDDILIALDIYDRKVFLRKVTCQLHEICKDVVREFAALIKEKKLKINIDIVPETTNVQADCEKLYKIVKILFKNAIVYSPAGGTISIVSQLESRDDRKHVVVTISDQGIGITESEREHIFEEFFRSNVARKIWPNGLGLGIFIAQAFVKAHGGELWFYSAGRNRGTDFHFALPVE